MGIFMTNCLTFWELVAKDTISILTTAFLVGVSVPAIKALMDDRHFRKQKDYERAIRLQESLLITKMKLLDDAATAYWKFYFCCIALTYNASERDTKFADEHQKYRADIWDAFANIRKVVSPAAYLLSREQFGSVIGTFLIHLENVDLEIEEAAETKKFDWGELHGKLHPNLASKINDALHDLAQALSITPDYLSRPVN
jgi:hypothetical protein